ncbi:uncharacterized protein RJT21DRAFT_119084 [Scheffersomyces amazonensis]|uniref:uncharacterized protein n=1 Tax=Scheffersomyces amazonensis TaxID=1078765 RepID=UPI00315DD508
MVSIDEKTSLPPYGESIYGESVNEYAQQSTQSQYQNQNQNQNQVSDIVLQKRNEHLNREYAKILGDHLIKYKDVTYEQIIDYFNSAEIPPKYKGKESNFINYTYEFFLHDGILYKKGNDGRFPLTVLRTIEDYQQVFDLIHKYNGARYKKSIYDLINLKYFVPKLDNLLNLHFKSCDTCQKVA